MSIRFNALFLIASSAVFLPVWAQNALKNPSENRPVAASSQASEQARIASERVQLQKNLDQSKQACYQKLAVTPCIGQAKAEHRAKMQELKRQEVGLNDARRKQAAAQRLAHLEARRLALDKDRGMGHQHDRAPKAKQGKLPERAARAAKNRQQAQDRAQALQERKAQAQKRQAERKKPPAAPLPV